VLPGILKTARMGYDGKGQIRVRNAEEVREAHASLAGVPCVLEKRLPLKFEVSALIARAASGASVVYPLAQNTHRDGVLSHTIVPAPDASPTLVQQAQQAALQIADKLGYVACCASSSSFSKTVRWSPTKWRRVPHNSGHYTVDACATSQFEQQVRA
jgi:Phosphoribosylaminoimidazole carboxylase (NCAIR synthetase)